MASDPLYRAVRPVLFSLDAERAHDLVLWWGSRVASNPVLLAGVRRRFAEAPDPILRVRAFGLDFASPIGLAAGLDKNGRAVDLWAAIGFGFAEVGTVTPGAGQPGNDKPRLARLVEERALVNRMGFNNAGATALAGRLAGKRSAMPVGANIGKAKDTPLERAADDYAACFRAVAPVSDYIAINVSSPNTPNLRSLQAVSALEPLLSRLAEENAKLPRPRPLLLKIAPDLADEDLDAIADLSLRHALAGVIATNTTIQAGVISRPLPIQGGISGAPLRPRALECTRRLFQKLGKKIPIVGVGGIATAEDAYRRVRAGATLLQIYTALIYEGPGLVRSIARGLAERLRADGFSSIADAVGVDAAG